MYRGYQTVKRSDSRPLVKLTNTSGVFRPVLSPPVVAEDLRPDEWFQVFVNLFDARVVQSLLPYFARS